MSPQPAEVEIGALGLLLGALIMFAFGLIVGIGATPPSGPKPRAMVAVAMMTDTMHVWLVPDSCPRIPEQVTP